MTEIQLPIVVAAYNRPRSLSRLLSSLDDAHYPNKNIELIISIDRSDDNENVLAIAENFDWRYGNKKIIYQEKKLGLKAHILKCGDLTQQYDGIVLLEDDLFVSPSFYYYAVNAIQFSQAHNNISGISLYKHELNVHTKENFNPYEDGVDNWYFQFASSWGQAWTKKQWFDFRKWFYDNPELKIDYQIPYNVTSWSNRSWLKDYIKYLIDVNKYFLYPKISFSTNFGDAGTHKIKDSTIYQVPLRYNIKKEFDFSSLEKSQSVYDAFFENHTLFENLGYNKNEICVDLYANKKSHNKRYWLTTKILDFKILKSFGRSLKPIDANIIRNIEGNDIFLYDTTVTLKNRASNSDERKITYNFKHLSYEISKKMFFYHLKMKVIRLLVKLKIRK